MGSSCPLRPLTRNALRAAVSTYAARLKKALNINLETLVRSKPGAVSGGVNPSGDSMPSCFKHGVLKELMMRNLVATLSLISLS